MIVLASRGPLHGVGHVGVLLDGLTDWMTWKGFDSVESVRGMLSVPDGTDPAGYARTGYVSVLKAAGFSYSRW